jgi:hypothetical protein
MSAGSLISIDSTPIYKHESYKKNSIDSIQSEFYLTEYYEIIGFDPIFRSRWIDFSHLVQNHLLPGEQAFTRFSSLSIKFIAVLSLQLARSPHGESRADAVITLSLDFFMSILWPTQLG